MEGAIREVINKVFEQAEINNLKEIKSGLINATFSANINDHNYIIQRINTDVFSNPEIIQHNLDELNNYLKQYTINYELISPIPDKYKAKLFYDMQGYCYRLFNYVNNSKTLDVVQNANQAYEAARQFASFTTQFENFDASILKPVIPNFHNLPLRYNQFNDAVYNAPEERKYPIRKEISELLNEFSFLVGTFNDMILNPDFKQRVMHHDAKISNVLFDEDDRGLCVIDLDTVMPGFILSDWGDMMRTYLSPANEEETDLEKVTVRKDVFEAVQAGYLEVLGHNTSNAEATSLLDSGMIIIYMQALRFMADHLNGDIYYGAKYEGQNYNRAINQIKLLRELQRFAKEQK